MSIEIKKESKMSELKSISIKGKDYVLVNERLKYFRENFRGYSLISEVLNFTEDYILIKAIIKDPDGKILATGLAHEKQDSSFINKTSFVENCETSAWGRALANLGIGIDTSVASAEELMNALKNQETTDGSPHNKATYEEVLDKLKQEFINYGKNEKVEKQLAYLKKHDISFYNKAEEFINER